MSQELEEKFKKIVSQLSEKEKQWNPKLAPRTAKVLVAIEYLKAITNKPKKGA